MTGGDYFRARDTAGLQEIYRLVDELEPVEEPESGFRPIRSLFHIPLAGAFVLAALLALASLIGNLRLRRAAREQALAG